MPDTERCDFVGVCLHRRVTDGFDVVATGIEDVGAVVVGVVDLAHARGAVVGRAGLERGGIERVDRFVVVNREGDGVVMREPCRRRRSSSPGRPAAM